MTDWLGRTLSKVEIQKRLGVGGMAEVFLGHHITLDRPVAVKILHSYLAEDESSLVRFRAEAQAVAGLRHPNIVQIYDFDVADGFPYMVMELLQGICLEDYLNAVHSQRRRLSPETTARLILSLAAALDYAHDREIVHRDVKPGNVILRREAGPVLPDVPLPLEVEPVLTDFGLAHFQDARRTLSGAILGTPAYLSPEQVRGETVDRRADIYALGMMLYEMLAGKLPFDAPSATPVVMLLKQLSDNPPPVPGIGAGVQVVLDRALAKDRQMRYQRAGDLAADLMMSIFGQGRKRVATAVAGFIPSEEPLPPLVSMLDALERLVEQAQAYQRALPSNNYPARAAVFALGELAQQALNEAHSLESAIKPQQTLPQPASIPFSPREGEVLVLAAQGLTNKEIAFRLGLSERTVQFHMNSLFNKTGTQSRTEVVALALRNGWIEC
jgi:serine/threonine protein kinase